MRQFSGLVAFVVVLFACVTPKQHQQTRSDLIHVIDSMFQADQATAKIRPPDSAAAAFQRVIRSNFPIAADIFRRYGFPGYDLVGENTSRNYFTLVQHSDFDLPFQQAVLKDMKSEVKKRNASGENFAFLTDRIEINSGRPQIYGTQIIMSGNTRIKPCVDTLNLDRRRKAVGLEPIQTYLDRCNEVFYQMNPQERKN